MAIRPATSRPLANGAPPPADRAPVHNNPTTLALAATAVPGKSIPQGTRAGGAVISERARGGSTKRSARISPPLDISASQAHARGKETSASSAPPSVRATKTDVQVACARASRDANSSVRPAAAHDS